MIEKTVRIGDQDVKFRSSASVPRLYRIKFGRDIFRDLNKLEQSFQEKSGENGSRMEVDDLEIFENVAYIMAYHADPTIPGTIDELVANRFDSVSIMFSEGVTFDAGEGRYEVTAFSIAFPCDEEQDKFDIPAEGKVLAKLFYQVSPDLPVS